MTGRSVEEELDRAIEERRRQVYLDGLNADYAALNADVRTLADFKKDGALWDATNLDELPEA
jgi:hypothetical protein